MGHHPETGPATFAQWKGLSNDFMKEHLDLWVLPSMAGAGPECSPGQGSHSTQGSEFPCSGRQQTILDGWAPFPPASQPTAASASSPSVRQTRAGLGRVGSVGAPADRRPGRMRQVRLPALTHVPALPGPDREPGPGGVTFQICRPTAW